MYNAKIATKHYTAEQHRTPQVAERVLYNKASCASFAIKFYTIWIL